MDAIKLIRDRQSVRAFLDKDVSDDTVRQILQTASFAPSGVNTQPWEVAVLGPSVRKKIAADLIAAKESKEPDCQDYQYYPLAWPDIFKKRRKACGLALYGALNITKGDEQKQKAQWYRNYDFFGASVGLIIHIDQQLETGSWIDLGMFIQNILLAARAFGLECCPQASIAERPDIIRLHTSIPGTQKIVCGIAIGYADWSHPINQYRTERESVDTFTTWIS